MPAGRPTIYSEKLAQRICDLVSTHDLGLPKLCRQYPDLPEPQTINAWRREKPEFSSKYAQAKMEQSELMAESITDIADDLAECVYHEHGTPKVDSGMVAMARLKIDTRKWLASKLAPKIYGDKKLPETDSNESTLGKIKEMVAEFNKVNESDV